MCLSNERSATIFFSFRFSSSNWRRRRSSAIPIPWYLRFQREKDCSLTPSCRQTSPTGFPDSTCFKAYVICSSVKRALRIVVPLYEDRKFTENYNFRNVQESGFGSVSEQASMRRLPIEGTFDKEGIRSSGG